MHSHPPSLKPSLSPPSPLTHPPLSPLSPPSPLTSPTHPPLSPLSPTPSHLYSFTGTPYATPVSSPNRGASLVNGANGTPRSDYLMNGSGGGHVRTSPPPSSNSHSSNNHSSNSHSYSPSKSANASSTGNNTILTQSFLPFTYQQQHQHHHHSHHQQQQQQQYHYHHINENNYL